MVIVNDPLFYTETVGQYEEKSLKQQSRLRKHKFQTQFIKETRDSGKRDKTKCPLCDDHDDIEEFQIFLSQSYSMDPLAIFPKNTMIKVVPIEECAKCVVENTPQYCMVSKFIKIRRKKTPRH